MSRPLRPLSRRQLDLFVSCPRCFWMLRRHEIEQPQGYPLALNTAMDRLLKAEFDEFRSAGEPHPVMSEHYVAGPGGELDPEPAGPVGAKLFSETGLLEEWRNNRKGIRWTDPLTGCVLFGAVDDVLEFPDGRLAAMDYKSSGAAQIKVYDSYRLQMDTYMFLLEKNGYRVSPRAYLAFFKAVKDDGFRGRLPFKGTMVAVLASTGRVGELFREALVLAEAEDLPPPGEGCEPCRWLGEVDEAAGEKLRPRAGQPRAGRPGPS